MSETVESKKAPISPGFFRGLVTVATIAVGVLYIEHHITATINDAIAPIVKKMEQMERDVNDLKQRVTLDEYRLDQVGTKPDEPRLKKRKS